MTTAELIRLEQRYMAAQSAVYNTFNPSKLQFDEMVRLERLVSDAHKNLAIEKALRQAK